MARSLALDESAIPSRKFRTIQDKIHLVHLVPFNCYVSEDEIFVKVVKEPNVEINYNFRYSEEIIPKI